VARWNTYNHYSCTPNETIVKSNAKALVDLGLADLGYRYVTTDCGWTVANRTAEGSLTWNETLFPSGFPALGQYIHDLGLLFGVYEDAGIRSCQTDMEQAGSLCKSRRWNTVSVAGCANRLSRSRGPGCCIVYFLEDRCAEM
jgi:alpha-galactosidase